MNESINDRTIDYLVVHCTATAQSTAISGIKDFWKNTLKWQDPGYHYIVRPDGSVVQLQDINKPSNGVKGHNENSIHISYIGGVDGKNKAVDNRSAAQKESLRTILKFLRLQFPSAKIQGHRDFSTDRNKNGIIDPFERIKECPCFDAIPEYADI